MSSEDDSGVGRNTEDLVARHARRRAERSEFDADQLAALDSLARAQKYDDITSEDAAEIESLIHSGQVPGARKRLTQARRDAQSEAP